MAEAQKVIHHVPKANALEYGAPSQDLRAFRRSLGHFATGVVVVTTGSGGDRTGVTVNSFSSVSLDPPLILWSIGKSSRSYEIFRSSGKFAINVLASDQIAISRQFSSNVDDKFAGISITESAGGSPFLDGALAQFDCVATASIDAGDHTILVGQVVEFLTYEGAPLLFSQGKYSVADEHPSLPVAPGETSSGSWWGDDPVSLIFEAHHTLSHEFEESRSLSQLTAPTARIIAALYSVGGMAFESLVRLTYLGELNAEDVIRSLLERGLIETYDGGFYRLTIDGRRVREENKARWEAFCANATRHLSQIEIDRLRRSLTSLTERHRA